MADHKTTQIRYDGQCPYFLWVSPLPAPWYKRLWRWVTRQKPPQIPPFTTITVTGRPTIVDGLDSTDVDLESLEIRQEQDKAAKLWDTIKNAPPRVVYLGDWPHVHDIPASQTRFPWHIFGKGDAEPTPDDML